MLAINSKNKALVLVIGIVLLLTILISFIIVLSLQPKPNTWYEPIDTEMLLPEPASVKMYYGEIEYPLSKETQQLVYETISEWFGDVRECSHVPAEQPYRPAEVRFEFIYNGPYKYVGTLGTAEPLSSEPLVYSALSLGWGIGEIGIIPTSTYLTPCKNGEHYGINNMKTSLIFGWQTIPNNKTFDNLILSAFLNTSPTNTGNEVVESDTFPAKPDSAIITKNGKSVLLTGEKLDELYQTFMQMTTQAVHFYSIFDEGKHSGKALNHTCVQFQYLKRQKYSPTTVPESGFGGSLTREQYYQGCEYDALLCIVEPSAPYSDLTHMIVDTYAKGTYAFSDYAWFIEKEFESYIEQFVN